VKRGRVLYYSIEDDKNFVGSRLQRMVAKMGMKAPDLADGLVVRDMTAANPPFIAQYGPGGISFEPEGERLLADMRSGEFDMVVLDNASEAFAGDENKRAQVASFYAPLRAAAGEGDCSVVIIAHVNRPSARGDGGNENYSGSTQWHNSARSRLSLKRDGDTNRLTLKQEKLNAKPPLKQAISGEFVDGVFEVERRTEKVEREESENNARATFKDLLEHIFMIEEEGKLLADNDHPTTQYKQLAGYSSWPKKYSKPAGKELIRQGVSHMKQEGLLEAEKGHKNGNKHRTVRLTELGKARALSVVDSGTELVTEEETLF
jgi:RecA-family ATPase